MTQFLLQDSLLAKDHYSIIDSDGSVHATVKPAHRGNYELSTNGEKIFSSPRFAFDAFCNANHSAADAEGTQTIEWNGQEYLVPTDSELESMAIGCVCLTPDGDEVEPDHPDSWLSILKLI